MSDKTKRKVKIKNLLISKENYEKILMWSMSEKEIYFVCIGNGNLVEKLVRLTNTSRNPYDRLCGSQNQYDFMLKSLKIASKNVLATGHSHPHSDHCRHPSRLDVKWLEKGKIELIAFPFEMVVKGWRIRSTLQKTLDTEIQLSVQA